jgi:GrpB-like predicted nucleotidyltransferase (UPF0157 family)
MGCQDVCGDWPAPVGPPGGGRRGRDHRVDRREEAGSGAEHVGSTAVPNLVGKNFVDLQITADPEDVPSIADTLLGLGFVRQRGPDAWPPERPMLEGTYRCRGAVFGVHAHVVPTTDPDVKQMAAFRDLLRRDRGALEAYVAEKRRILEQTHDLREYTDAKRDVIARHLAHRSTDRGELG